MPNASCSTFTIGTKQFVVHEALEITVMAGVIVRSFTPHTMVASLPIRLRHTPATCWVRPVAGIKLGIGRRLYITGDAEQRAESVERVEAPVEAKREFVEVGL